VNRRDSIAALLAPGAACRSADRAAEQVRNGDQSEDCTGARNRGTAVRAPACRPGDRVKASAGKPALAVQPRHARELAQVARDEGQARTRGVRRDQRIERSDGRTGRFKLRSHNAVSGGCDLIERHRVRPFAYTLQGEARRLAFAAFRDAEAQFGERDRRNHQVAGRRAVKALEHGLVLRSRVQHIDERVGVEHVAHQRPDRVIE